MMTVTVTPVCPMSRLHVHRISHVVSHMTLPSCSLDSSALDGVASLQRGLHLGTEERVAGDIFQRDSAMVVGGEGLEEEEREFRDRLG